MSSRMAAAATAMLAMKMAAAVAAPNPSPSQISAIRQNCRGDYPSVCGSVPTGGSAALQCLAGHLFDLSAACQGAVSAVTGSPGAAPPSIEPASAVAEAPAGWPHTIDRPDGSVTVYEPQVTAWPDRTHLKARAAVSITPRGRPAFLGTIDIAADTLVDHETRDVTISSLVLEGSHFPTLDTGRATEVEGKLRAAIAQLPDKHIPIDTILLSLAGSEASPPSVELRNAPPAIFFSSTPASLLVFDGEPVLVPVGKSGLRRAVNTNWTVLVDQQGSAWFLLANGVWYTAHDSKGEWTPTVAVPPAFRALPNDPTFAAARAAMPPRPPAARATIIVSTVPAEMIVTQGDPVFAAVPGTRLHVVTNTDFPLYRDADGQFYVLLSGRWFAAASLTGPWRYATPDLPADFARLPPAGPHADALASVPGTAQSQAAVLAAGLPRTATLSRAAARIVVTYAGPPRFVPIEGTSLQRSINSPYGVIKAGGRYYVCVQGAWFEAKGPLGPWALAADIPKAIYAIPVTSPLYPVTYVRVTAATPTTVTYGYTAGYAMGFVSAGVVVYGTGYYYPPVVIPGPVPIYFPYPYSYAGGVWYSTASAAWVHGGYAYGPYGGGARWGTAYNPATGAWASGGAIYGPNGGVAGFNAYNPSTGSYAHGSASWGPYGGTANASFYNASTGVSGSTHQNANAYGRWGSSTVSGPNQTVHTESGSNARGTAAGFSSSTGAEGAVAHGRNGNTAGVGRAANGDVYAGANGNVYKHTDSGWSKWDNGGWNPVQTPDRNGSDTARVGGANGTAREPGASNAAGRDNWSGAQQRQLDQDRTARTQGMAQQRSFQSGRFGGGGNWRGQGGRGFRR